METKQAILTGIKPTGRPHLGNYVGMIRPTIDLIKANSGALNVLFIANYHALNTINDPGQLRDHTYDIAASLLACGLDTAQTIFYRQSDVAEIFELAAIIASVTPKGLMNRAHAYKAAVDRNRSEGLTDVDVGINMGLYTYPILMAADILLFDADVVPVGKDQVQHVEFARDIAGYFNRAYGPGVLKLPRHVVQPDAAAIPGIDGRKMSKSYGNTIPLFASAQEIEKLVRRVKTDARRPEESKTADESILFQIYSAIASADETAGFKEKFETGGMSYGQAKTLLTEKIVEEFTPRSARYHSLLQDRTEIDDILRVGAEQARRRARAVMLRVRDAIGV
jgi:tryptophanyl-tRNA synthetase